MLNLFQHLIKSTTQRCMFIKTLIITDDTDLSHIPYIAKPTQKTI